MKSNALRVILLLASLALAALALAGCNSRAAFPYDQSLCGNGRIDDNEPCDLIMPGDYWQFHSDLCHNRPQYAGGPTHCTSSCEPNYEFCIDRADCNAFQASGCDSGKSCYFFPESRATGCAAPGGRPPGDRCDDSSQCQPLSMCVDQPMHGKICSLLCDRNAPQCPGGTPCLTGDDFPPPMGYCEHLALECDPITNNMCVYPANCYFFLYLETKVQCAPTADSPSREGQGCGSSDQCYPTLTCINGDCRQLCNTGTECAPGHQCFEGLGFLDYGVCPLGKSCDPVTGAGCRGWLDCNFSEDATGDRFCGQVGQKGEHMYCESRQDCRPGFFCTGLQDENLSQNCHRLCNEQNLCMGGDVCAFFNNEFLPGVCVIPRLCDVLENTGCDPPFTCTIVNDHGNTACMLPGPAQPGEPCNLLRSCVSGQFCDNQGGGNRVCRHTCNRINTIECPTGGNCTQMPWNPELPNVGICK